MICIYPTNLKAFFFLLLCFLLSLIMVTCIKNGGHSFFPYRFFSSAFFFFLYFVCIWSMNAMIMAFQNEWPTFYKSLTSSAHVFFVLLVLMHSTFRAGSAHQKHIYYEYKYIPLSVFSSYYYLYACTGKSEMTSLFNTDI